MARVAGLVLMTSTMLPAYVIRRRFTPPSERDQVRARWAGVWASSLLNLFGIRVLAQGPMLGADRGHLVVANHRSAADILLVLRAFGGTIVSRSDIARWPLFGRAARVVGTVFVDRSDAVSGAHAVRTIRALLRAKATVIIFPEGTTYPDDEVRPFFAGAFVAAMHMPVDIVPVGIAYGSGSGAAFVNESFGAHLSRMAGAPPSTVAMCVGRPIAIDSSSRSATLRDESREAVQSLVRAARLLVDGTGGESRTNQELTGRKGGNQSSPGA
jgi:1-acyl-sn-glycerol-3-phosphate acyltransferase